MNLTAVVPVKVVPVMTTSAPRIPVVVESVRIFGVTLNVSVPPVPAGLVTWTGPVCAPAGTAALRELAVTLLGAALTPLNVTSVDPPRLEPLTVTRVPTGPELGASELTVGTRTTVNGRVFDAPAAVVIWIFPVVAVGGTWAVIWPSLSTM